MTDPDSESEEHPPVSEMRRIAIWTIAPLGALWAGLYIVTHVFPDWSPYWQMGAVVIPGAAVLYGIGLWRKRNHA